MKKLVIIFVIFQNDLVRPVLRRSLYWMSFDTNSSKASKIQRLSNGIIRNWRHRWNWIEQSAPLVHLIVLVEGNRFIVPLAECLNSFRCVQFWSLLIILACFRSILYWHAVVCFANPPSRSRFSLFIFDNMKF